MTQRRLEELTPTSRDGISFTRLSDVWARDEAEARWISRVVYRAPHDAPLEILRERLHTLLSSFINSTRITRGSAFLPERLTRFRTMHLMRDVAEALACLDIDHGLLTANAENHAVASPAMLAAVIAAGYRVLRDTDAPSMEHLFVAPGSDVAWRAHIAETASLHPLQHLQSHLATLTGSGLVGAWVHGSVATLDYVEGYSDLDLALLLSTDSCCHEEELLRLRRQLGRVGGLLRGIDPLQHHGYFVVSELDLRSYHESQFPLTVWCHAQRLDAFESLPLQLNLADDSWRSLKVFLEHVQHVWAAGAMKWRPKTAYDAKLFLQTVVMIPVLALQTLQNEYRYKRDALPAAQDLMTKRIGEKSTASWNVIRCATRLRETWNYRPLLTPTANRLLAKLGPSYRLPEVVERLYSVYAVHEFNRRMGSRYMEEAVALSNALVDLVYSAFNREACT